MRPEDIEFCLHFVLACAVVALATSMIREGSRRTILREGTHFFTLMTVGIAILVAIVFAFEFLFIRQAG